MDHLKDDATLSDCEAHRQFNDALSTRRFKTWHLATQLKDELAKLSNTVDVFLREHSRHFENLSKPTEPATRALRAIRESRDEFKGMEKTLESQVTRCDALIKEVSYYIQKSPQIYRLIDHKCLMLTIQSLDTGRVLSF